MNTHAVIHIARKQLALDDETARDIYEQVTGKRSLKLMSESERLRVVSALEQKGFKRSSRTRRNGQKMLTGEFAKKLQAIWIAGWNLGVVRNRDDAALLKFVKRQTGIDHTRFLNHAEDANKAIEALKAWLARETPLDWSTSKLDPLYTLTPGFKVAWTQWRMLGHGSEADSTRQFWMRVHAITGCREFGENGPNSKHWVLVMNTLGKELRRH